MLAIAYDSNSQAKYKPRYQSYPSLLETLISTSKGLYKGTKTRLSNLGLSSGCRRVVLTIDGSSIFHLN